MLRFRGGSSSDNSETGSVDASQSNVPANPISSAAIQAPPVSDPSPQVPSPALTTAETTVKESLLGPKSTPAPQVSSPMLTTAETTVNESLLGPKSTPAGPLRKAFPAFPWRKMPNYLTYMRCISIPIFVYLFYQPNQHVATSFLFAFASFTDWLDGYLARRWDISSPFGAFLDPVADKLMVSTSLILLTGRYGLKLAIPTSIILAREIAVSALREWMATRGARDAVKVGWQGKVKTALTMLALTLMLAVPADGAGALGKLMLPAELMLYASTLLTVTSGSVYFRAAAPVLKSSK
jgi:CDP-diacylglycerol--glycerol-3-phosphate 3-phosphatidyltransferase